MEIKMENSDSKMKRYLKEEIITKEFKIFISCIIEGISDFMEEVKFWISEFAKPVIISPLLVMYFPLLMLCLVLFIPTLGWSFKLLKVLVKLEERRNWLNWLNWQNALWAIYYYSILGVWTYSSYYFYTDFGLWSILIGLGISITYALIMIIVKGMLFSCEGWGDQNLD